MHKEGRESRRQDGCARQLIYPQSSAIHGRVRFRVLGDWIDIALSTRDLYDCLRRQFT